MLEKWNNGSENSVQRTRLQGKGCIGQGKGNRETGKGNRGKGKGNRGKGKGNRGTGSLKNIAGNRVQRTWWRDQGAGDRGAENKGILSTSLLKSMCARA